MLKTGICCPRVEGSTLYHSRGLVSSALVDFNTRQRWHFRHIERNIYSVRLEPISLYLDREVFERNFEIVEEG